MPAESNDATADPERNYLFALTLPNGRRAAVVPLLFERARLVLVSADDPYSYEDVW